jgi:hypothetical protein
MWLLLRKAPRILLSVLLKYSPNLQGFCLKIIIMGCDTMQFSREVPTYLSNMLPLSHKMQHVSVYVVILCTSPAFYDQRN